MTPPSTGAYIHSHQDVNGVVGTISNNSPDSKKETGADHQTDHIHQMLKPFTTLAYPVKGEDSQGGGVSTEHAIPTAVEDNGGEEVIRHLLTSRPWVGKTGHNQCYAPHQIDQTEGLAQSDRRMRWMRVKRQQVCNGGHNHPVCK